MSDLTHAAKFPEDIKASITDLDKSFIIPEQFKKFAQLKVREKLSANIYTFILGF